MPDSGLRSRLAGQGVSQRIPTPRKKSVPNTSARPFLTRPVVLEIRNWDSHRLATRMAEILLTEVLGLKVEVHEWVARKLWFEDNEWWQNSGTRRLGA